MPRPPVAPYLTCSPALAAIAFYSTVFDATQKAFMPALVMHCELSLNGGAVMVADAFPEFGLTRIAIPGELVTVSISLEFDDPAKVDEVFKKATSLAAKPETQPMMSLWGTRLASFRDPFGHRWILNAPLG